MKSFIDTLYQCLTSSDATVLTTCINNWFFLVFCFHQKTKPCHFPWRMFNLIILHLSDRLDYEYTWFKGTFLFILQEVWKCAIMWMHLNSKSRNQSYLQHKLATRPYEVNSVFLSKSNSSTLISTLLIESQGGTFALSWMIYLQDHIWIKIATAIRIFKSGAQKGDLELI